MPLEFLCASMTSSGPFLRLVAGAGSEVDDAELVRRGQLGDRLALEALYDRHVRVVYARAARLLGRTSEAEDATQDAFVEAFRDLARLRDTGRFGSWLLGIVVHQVHRRYRRRRLLARLGLDRGDDDARLEVIAVGMGAEERADLGRVDLVLAKLPADVRIAWMLRYVEGFSLVEVAESTSCSLATVKRRIARAEREFARVFGPFEAEETP